MASFLPYLFVAAAGWILFNQLLAYRRAQASTSWPKTKGQIKYAQRQVLALDEFGNLSGVNIIYTYRVNNQEYTGKTISFSPRLGGLRRLLQKYQAGKTVAVHYDPKNPAMATLETGVTPTNHFAIGVGVLLLAMAALYLFAGFAS